MTNRETWKTVVGFPNYSVSNKGKVCLGKRVLQFIKHADGYFLVTSHKKDKVYRKFVHHLVLEAFVGKCPKGYQTNHKDGIKSHNFVENLEWVTPSENTQHAYDTGLCKAWLREGERNPKTKLKNAEVWLIKRLLWFDIRHKIIARMFKVDRCVITNINRGICWIHVRFEPTEKDRKYYRESIL